MITGKHRYFGNNNNNKSDEWAAELKMLFEQNCRPQNSPESHNIISFPFILAFILRQQGYPLMQ